MCEHISVHGAEDDELCQHWSVLVALDDSSTEALQLAQTLLNQSTGQTTFCHYKRKVIRTIQVMM